MCDVSHTCLRRHPKRVAHSDPGRAASAAVTRFVVLVACTGASLATHMLLLQRVLHSRIRLISVQGASTQISIITTYVNAFSCNRALGSCTRASNHHKSPQITTNLHTGDCSTGDNGCWFKRFLLEGEIGISGPRPSRKYHLSVMGSGVSLRAWAVGRE